MKLEKFRKSVATLVAALVVAGSAAPVMAEGGVTYTPVRGSESVVFEKYLVMDENANVPNETFNFTITPGAAQAATATSSKVYAGNDGNVVAGTPTIGTATFTTEDATYTTAQDLPSSVNVQKMNGTNVIKDDVTLTEGQKYARKDVVINFGSVSFKEPGVYRYLVNETAGTEKGITYDNTQRVLDVYVEDNSATTPNTLRVAGYVLHKNAADAVVPKDGSMPTGKASGFTNSYSTHDLTISKAVTGNQASRDEYFEFTLNITGAVAGTKYTVDLENAEVTTKKNAINTTAHTNPALLTANESGEVTQTFWLQGGQSIVVRGLANNTAYTVGENKTTMGDEGYTTTAAITGDTKTGDNQDIALNTDLQVVDTAITADTTVAFTNAKNGTIPTGILNSLVPGALTLVGAASAIVVMAKNRKEEK